MLKFWAGLTAGVTLICAGYALASRNSAGTMSRVNGPYVTGNTISSSAVNARFSDIETEITNSLDRSGRGGMLSALRGTDGTVAAPAFSFTSEAGSGLYRIGAGDLGWAISGGKKLELTASAFTITPATTLTAGVTAGLGLDVGAANNGVVTANALQFGGVGGGFGEGIGSKRTATGNQFGLDFYTNSVARMQIGNTGTVTMSTPLVIGATGTAISASYRGTTSWTPGSVAPGACTTTTIALTGAAAGADCVVTPPSSTYAVIGCTVTLNTCNPYACNANNANATPPSGTYACRVFNP